MKVLVGIPCLLTGGTEIQTLSLVQALIAAGHQPNVVCYFEFSDAMVERYRQAGATVNLLSPGNSRPAGIRDTTALLFHGLRRAVKDIKPDVAHIQYMAPGAIPLIILRLLGVKRIVATAHTAADIYSPRGLKIIRMLNNRILSSFQCITEVAERSFFGSSQIFGADTRLNRHGNHFTIHNNLPSYISIRKSPRKTTRKITVGVVSRLAEIKGMDLVVPAFTKAIESLPTATARNMRLLVVGDGDQRRIMEQQAKELGMADITEFAGRQPQNALQDFYDQIDILLMPSRSEGFGLTAIEGMARGCVPVVANIGGLPEVVRNGLDGLLHRPEDIDDIAYKIITLASDSDMRVHMSDSAQQRAENFSTERYAESIARWYRKL